MTSQSVLITDSAVLATVRNGWTRVQLLLERFRLLTADTLAHGEFASPTPADVVYNTSVLLASDVLRLVLCQAAKEKKFIAESQRLSVLVDAARDSLHWVDWTDIRAGVDRRNQIDRHFFPVTQCTKDIEAIERQLMAWGVIEDRKL